MDEELFHILLDNQKSLWNLLDINEKIKSYDELKTSSIKNDISVSEENIVMTDKQDNTIYIVIKRINNKIYKQITGLIDDRKIEKEITYGK